MNFSHVRSSAAILATMSLSVIHSSPASDSGALEQHVLGVVQIVLTIPVAGMFLLADLIPIVVGDTTTGKKLHHVMVYLVPPPYEGQVQFLSNCLDCGISIRCSTCPRLFVSGSSSPPPNHTSLDLLFFASYSFHRSFALI